MCITFGNPSDPCCDDAPAVPFLGFIQRHVYPEPIADDAGLSDANWSTGITGNVEPNVNRSCLYHHFTTPDKRNTSVFNILQPLRWSIETPANDGAPWDHWTDLTVGGTHPDYKSGQLTFDGFNTVALREKLLPRDWHARFFNGIAKLANFPRPYVCNRDFDVLDLGGGESYLEQALQAIAPSVPPWQIDGNSDTYPVTSQVYAFRHVVNGVPGRVCILEDAEDDAGEFVRVTPADTYQIDIWYRIGLEASLLFSASPGKGCAYWPLRRLSNGSRQGSPYLLAFYNVDFSPNYDPNLQAFALAVAGHTGWTLREGSNGPHVLVTNDDWHAASTAGGAAVQTDDPASFWALIQLNFAREIPEILFAPGAALKAKYPNIAETIMYRPVDNPGLYRKSSTSADYGSVTHASSGRFYQDGTTVFELVPWTVEGGISDESDGFISFLIQQGVARFDSSDSPPAYREVPRRIIINRVSR